MFCFDLFLPNLCTVEITLRSGETNIQVASIKYSSVEVKKLALHYFVCS